jgi:hypothetical protein
MSNKAIIDLGIDLARGSVSQYSSEQANEILRKAMLDLAGCEDGKFDYKKFRRNQVAIFEVLEEILDATIEEGIKNQFDGFVDYRSTRFGDKLSFRRKNHDLFEISMIAGGTNNLRRQRLSDSSFTIETNWEGVKIYEELERFLAGQVDWVGMINTVDRSFQSAIASRIYQAVKAAYSGLTAPYYESGSWDIDTFNTIVDHVQAATGMKPIVFGTRAAVSKAEPKYINYGLSSLEQRNQDGYFRTIDGITFSVIPQAHIPGTDTFTIDDDFLLIVPNGDEKIIKLVTEGETLIKEVNGQDNADDSQEYTVRKKYGVGVVSASKYGVYILA